MKIIVDDFDEYQSINQWILGKLDGSDYEQGELEDMRGCIRNQAEMLARLIEAVVPQTKLASVVEGFPREVKFED